MKKVKTFFCKQFKKILSEKDITQQELAEKLGIAQSMISQWLTGISNPNLNTLKKLCSVFDVPLSYFLENYENDNDKYKKLLQIEEENSKIIKEILKEIKEFKKLIK